MFKGTIPTPVQQMVKEIAGYWDCPKVYIGCSGNFTTERVLSEVGRFRLHSNDVTIYSAAVGNCYAQQDMAIKPNERLDEVFPWMADSCQNPTDLLATILLATRVMEGVDNQGNLKENAYYHRILAAYQSQWDVLHEKTVTKVEANYVELDSYTCEDVVDWIASCPQDQAFICYPPFYGAAGYEAQFGKLEFFFDWTKPGYTDFGADGVLENFWKQVTDREYWLFGSKYVWPEYEQYIRGLTRTRSRSVPIYLYSSHGATRLMLPDQALDPLPNLPRLAQAEPLGDHMTLHPLKGAEFDGLRAQYMNAEIPPATPGAAFAVCVDTKFIGCFAWSNSPHPGSMMDISGIYQLSDFPVAPTDYPRLSKLVLMASLSSEAKMLAERTIKRRVRRAFTTAFSNAPASMKYRGIYRLYSRKEMDPKEPPHKKYMINYEGDFSDQTLDQQLATWKKKHGKKG